MATTTLERVLHENEASLRAHLQAIADTLSRARAGAAGQVDTLTVSSPQLGQTRLRWTREVALIRDGQED